MKLIHCADLHLDSKMTANLSKEQAKERKAEILRTFNHMVEYASKNQAYGIMICGDMFDTRTVSATARNIVKGAIEGHPELHFFYLKGNHDDDSFLSKLDTIPENLHLFANDWTSYTKDRITITGMEMDETSTSTMYHSLVLNHDHYNIVMLHGQIAGYAASGKAEVISLDSMKNKNVDYLALGHVHDFCADKIDARGMFAYSGCLEGRGFDECGPKGFIELDVDEETLTATYRFVSIATRTLFDMEVDVSGAGNTNEAAQKIEAAINDNQYSSNSLVKISLVGELDVECELNLEYLTEMFSEYFYCVKVKDQTQLRIRYEDYEKDQSLKGEFVRMVLSSDVDEQEKAEIIRCGILALAGEEF